MLWSTDTRAEWEVSRAQKTSALWNNQRAGTTRMDPDVVTTNMSNNVQGWDLGAEQTVTNVAELLSERAES